MSRLVASIFSSIRRTSWSKLMSFACECFFRSLSFSSSSMMGLSNSSGCIFTGEESLDGHGVAFAHQRRQLAHAFRPERIAAAGRVFRGHGALLGFRWVGIEVV